MKLTTKKQLKQSISAILQYSDLLLLVPSALDLCFKSDAEVDNLSCNHYINNRVAWQDGGTSFTILKNIDFLKRCQSSRTSILFHSEVVSQKCLTGVVFRFSFLNDS